MADIMGRVNVKITVEDGDSSNLGRTVDLKATNPRDYAEILRDVQKQVNVALTQLVEQQLAAAENTASDDEADSDESDSDEPSRKRKISRPENPNKKNKV